MESFTKFTQPVKTENTTVILQTAVKKIIIRITILIGVNVTESNGPNH